MPPIDPDPQRGAIADRLSRAVWMDRFGVRLMALKPRMNAVTAAMHAVASAQPAALAADPEITAEAFAAQLPDSDA